MFDIISTAQNTQWTSFPTLCAKYTYPHVANEDVDFQVVPGKNCFAGFNKRFGFELLRTSSKDGKEVVQRLKKRQVDDLSCGAIATSGAQIAIGLTTGFIRLFNVQSAEFVPVKFKPDRMGNSVIGLHYSNTDQHLAAVYDSYDINLYGLKTGIKTDTFRLPGMSTLVRFHPAKQFVLAVGAYEGGITMQDIQTKKKLFYDKNAHDAPVRDIAMFDSSPEIFVSCSYDRKIKVFDLRKRAAVEQHVQAHPMSTVSVSPCGTFCVAGDLKGHVISYDFRSMKSSLDRKHLHDSAVVRVAFVPSVTSTSNMTLNQTANATVYETANSISSISSRLSGGLSSGLSNGQDSFAKFVDVCHYNNANTTEMATPKRRDSWSDLMPNKKFHDFSMDSVAETPSRMSFMADNHSDSILHGQSQTNVDQADQSVPEIRIFKPVEKKDKSQVEPKRRRLTEKIALEGIVEEELSDTGNELEGAAGTSHKTPLSNVNHKEFANAFALYVKRIKGDNDATPTNVSVNTRRKDNRDSHIVQEDDKENRQSNQQSSRLSIPPMWSLPQTPNRRKGAEFENSDTITIGTGELNQMLNEVLSDKFAALESEVLADVQKWKTEVATVMTTKIKELSRQVHQMQGQYFHSDFNHRYVSHMGLEKELEMFEEGLAAMLHRDAVETQFPIYTAELEDLRTRFEQQQSLNHP